MSVTRPPTANPQTPDQYEIRLAGHLHARWNASFEGFILTHESNGTTVLTERERTLRGRCGFCGFTARRLYVSSIGCCAIMATSTRNPYERRPAYRF